MDHRIYWSLKTDFSSWPVFCQPNTPPVRIFEASGKTTKPLFTLFQAWPSHNLVTNPYFLFVMLAV